MAGRTLSGESTSCPFTRNDEGKEGKEDVD